MANYLEDRYRLLAPGEIQSFYKIPPFPWKGRDEEMFRKFIEYCQPLFDNFPGFLQGTDKRWVGPDGLIAPPPLYEIPNNPGLADPVCVWLDLGHCVTVKLQPDGKFSCATNGRHRLYVAKKYGYRIPVYVGSDYGL